MQVLRIILWGPREIAGQVKILATRPDDLSLISGLTWRKEKADSKELSSAYA